MIDRKYRNEIPLYFEKGKNYYLFNLEFLFKDFNEQEIEILKKIIDFQKIEPLQLKDLIECEGILKNNPIKIDFD